MRLLVCSEEDEASVNIRDRLLEAYRWVEEGVFDGHPVMRRGETILVTIDLFHLYADMIDRRFEEDYGKEVDHVIFLSRHRAESGIPSLTVHPLGNWGRADFGGRDETLVPASPHLMTSILRILKDRASHLRFETSFEVTHHGPYLGTPAMYVEIGSDESMWGHREAAEVVASAIMEAQEERSPVAIGIGGGHYAPRFSDVASTSRISFGHMMPTYAIKGKDEEAFRRMVHLALEASNDATMAYVQKKSMKRSEATATRKILEEMGAEVVDSGDLDPL